MKRGRAGHLRAGVVITAAALTAILEMGSAWEPPSADEIVRKFLTARASAPRIQAADVTVALRLRIPSTAPPNCVYIGTLRSGAAGYTITIERELRHSLICGLADPHRANFLTVARETLDAVVPLPQQAQALALRLDQFDFTVRDQKVTARGPRTDWVYLLEGRAKDPNHDPRAFRGWIDYDEALWEEGTLTYSWGQVDTKQKYTRLPDAWVLTDQYIHSTQYDASLEAVYSNFQFRPAAPCHPGPSGSTDRAVARIPIICP